MAKIDGLTRDGCFECLCLGVGGDLVEMVENQTEFVTTDPRNHVTCAQACLQDAGDMQQNSIAGLMPVAIVDGLEAVKIDEQYRGRGLVPRGLMQDTLKLTQKGAPVGQGKQSVRIRQPLKFFKPRAQIGERRLQAFIFVCQSPNDSAVKILQFHVPQNATQRLPAFILAYILGVMPM
mgnify:CR=1 FL=1